MEQEIYSPEIVATLVTRSPLWDEYEHLRPFTASFEVQSIDGEEKPNDLGVITGWFGISVLDRPVADEADGISADSAEIGRVAQEILESSDFSEGLLEHVLLVDRIQIEPEYRGQGMLPDMVDALVFSFGFQKAGCVLVTQPEPQKPGGGPYPDGPLRSEALSGLQRSLEAAGFSAWGDGKCYSRIIAVT